jgi:aspartyl-tRNA synthetase
VENRRLLTLSLSDQQYRTLFKGSINENASKASLVPAGMREKASKSDDRRRREYMNQREEHRSLYLSYLACCNEHDVDRMATFYTSAMQVNDVLMERAAVAAQFPPLFSAFPDWHWEMRHLVVDGGYIAVHFAVTGTHRGTFQGIEATGRRVAISEFTLYRLEGGKFAEVWDLADMQILMKQIGQGGAPL